jgi:hypothetical protein
VSLAVARPNAFDEAEAEAFAGQIMDVLNAGAVAVMISLGHRAGLFDVLGKLRPASSERIAEAAELDERYVREWLAGMVTARIVEYDPAQQHYCLPAAHAACLTRGAPLGNLAVYGQHVATMGQLQDEILERFEDGGGTSYADYPLPRHHGRG